MIERRALIRKLEELAEKNAIVLGYIYPHFPIELVLAHGIIPTLIRPDPDIQGAFENSLQTFACGYVRNLFSQRVRNRLTFLNGIVFPQNTCDALQNVGDVWRYRYSKDRLFLITYPVGNYGDESVVFLSEELRLFNDALEKTYGTQFSMEKYHSAVNSVNRFRENMQFLYCARMVRPSAFSYTETVALIERFLTISTEESMREISKAVSGLRDELEREEIDAAERLRNMIISGRVTSPIVTDKSRPRLILVGGMIDPHEFAQVLSNAIHTTHSIVTDMFSFAFKTIFTPPVAEGDPFVEMARAILLAPREPTQEGLAKRVELLRSILINLNIDGLILCEQSFCDPDEFEAPSIEKVARDANVRVVRIHTDPEWSDRKRVEMKVQSFIENIGGG